MTRMMCKIALFLALASGVATASPVTWYLHDVYINGEFAGQQGYIWGDFTYDADTATMLGWHLYEDPVPGTFPDSFYTEGVGSGACCGSLDTSHIRLGDYTRYLIDGRPFTGFLSLVLLTPLTDFATLSYVRPFQIGDILEATSVEFYAAESAPGEVFRYVSTGYVSTTGPGSAPEPTTLLYVLPCLWLLGAARAKRRLPPVLVSTSRPY